MSSRLDRLFVLLESGTSSVTRRAAAKQLGEVQRLHPHELHSLLSRIKTYLSSPSWDTRIAAGQAIQAVIENVPQWDPTPVPDDQASSTPSRPNRLNLSKFDITSVLSNGVHLTGSEGTEYDVTEEGSPCDVTKQRHLLNAKIGLDVTHKIGIELDDLIGNEDLLPGPSDVQKSNFSGKSVGEMVQQEISQAGGLSSRERNRARRKARQLVSKQRSVDVEEEEPKRKKNRPDLCLTIDVTENVPDATGSWDVATDWPFEAFCDQLLVDLFSPRWESRHGAATALREVISKHGAGAGKAAGTTARQMSEDHDSYLQDLSLRLVCVLSLDRFGDFVSDQVVAPVRETCSQCLGACLVNLTAESVLGVLDMVKQLTAQQRDWEARHGGLLAVRYMLTLRQDLIEDLLPRALPSILDRLSDEVDDVSAVAAAALIPVAGRIVTQAADQLGDIVDKLWELLLEQDELAAACNSFMGLLAALLNIPDTRRHLKPQPLSNLLPRLWPFLSHNSTSVRKSTLQTLRTLTSNSDILACGEWTQDVLQPALRHVFQRALVEVDPLIRDLACEVWSNLLENSGLNNLLLSACPMFSTWLCLTMQNARSAFDPNFLVVADPMRQSRRNGRLESPAEQRLFLGGTESTNLELRERNSVQARCTASRMLGLLCQYIVQLPPGLTPQPTDPGFESPIDCLVKLLMTHLNSKSALQRMVCGLVILHWAATAKTKPAPPPLLLEKLQQCLSETVYYDELSNSFLRLFQEVKDYSSLLRRHGLSVNDVFSTGVFTLDQILELVKNKEKIKAVEERRVNIESAARQLIAEQSELSVSCQAALAGALIELQSLPEKLNPVIKPIMESIRRENCEPLQSLAAQQLSHLVKLCADRTPCPNMKIIANLCTYLCADPEFTPKIYGTDGREHESDQTTGILSLQNQQRSAERALLKRQGSTGGRGPGRPPASVTMTDASLEEISNFEEDQKWNRIQRRGATTALRAMAARFGEELPKRLPKLWGILRGFGTSNACPEEIVTCLQVLELTCSALHANLMPLVLDTLPALCQSLRHPLAAIRHMAARCLASLCSLHPPEVMEHVVCTVLPLVASTRVVEREGAAEAVHCIVTALSQRVLPYVVLLIVPLLGRMSDQVESVRAMCTQSFACLIQLMPLDSSLEDDKTVSHLSERRERDRTFIQQLFHPKSIPDYRIPVHINAELRPYQQAGVNWLAFLNKYKLHGILCDDMGLGKTLQSLCMLAGDHYDKQQEYMKSQSPECRPLPSLVICPPTLTGHWVYEAEKFVSREHLKPLHYCGPPNEREKLRGKVGSKSLVVASYDIVRKDVEFFKAIKWNYCVLDEGHIIKNGKTKASKAIKTLIANHRLILSGTPIQNNVLELWSLFDFLMPGFLSGEKQFCVKYSRPILASREPKSSAKEQEAGVVAMESLHRQVLPFLLRRVKEDVLKDLPPKITQDFICELSPLQTRLYEDFARSQANRDLSSGNSHVFQALRYLQNVCNHPKLVLTEKHPQYEPIMASLKQNNQTLDDINHACKLPALKQLLLDCGIGGVTDACVSQHRALVFCQLRSVLDTIERDLLWHHMPQVTYLRLDGTVPPSQRHTVVSKFNSDPSIDILLLTTQVGGLGLNLTGADTVIFVEHDWNPMKDLQAMDRAHRIGQKKVVNVYRLITRGTLEEKIMGLQKFKLLTANTVISSENKTMETMNTHQLLDLFTLRTKDNTNSAAGRGQPGTSSGLQVPGVPVKSLLEGLPELWEQQQYEEEYDLTNFMKNLGK